MPKRESLNPERTPGGEPELDEVLSRPGAAVVELMRRLEGDLMFLGAAGKMGVTLARMAARAVEAAGVRKRVIGVSRFSDPASRRELEEHGVETIPCDVLDPEAVARLPSAANVLFMVGRKFGTAGDESQTWAINAVAPGIAARAFAGSRIVAFSTGCVYPLVSAEDPGCREDTPPAPVGEYAQSCLGRERVFEFYSRRQKTPVLLYRLNYAIDLRYGVLHDIARWIKEGRPVPLNVPAFNCLWQRDANERALLCLEQAASPANVLNITGGETVTVREAAERMAEGMGRSVSFAGKPGPKAYLADASASIECFGPPAASIDALLSMTAEWVERGGSSLDKPTHFEVCNGNY